MLSIKCANKIKNVKYRKQFKIKNDVQYNFGLPTVSFLGSHPHQDVVFVALVIQGEIRDSQQLKLSDSVARFLSPNSRARLTRNPSFSVETPRYLADAGRPSSRARELDRPIIVYCRTNDSCYTLPTVRIAANRAARTTPIKLMFPLRIRGSITGHLPRRMRMRPSAP